MSNDYSVFVCDKCAREKGLEQFTPPPLLSGPCIHCGDETTSTGPNPNRRSIATQEECLAAMRLLTNIIFDARNNP